MNPYLKAIAPAIQALALVFILWVSTGTLDAAALEVGIVGLVSAALSGYVSNAPAGAARYAKALAPAIVTVVGVAAHAVITNEFDETEARLAVAGLMSALMTLVIPNVGQAVRRRP